MMRGLKKIFTGVPLGILVLGAVAGVVLGSAIWTGLAAVLAVAVAAPRILSRRARLLEEVATVGGALDRGRLDDLERLSESIRGLQGIAGAEQQGLQLAEQLDGVNAKYLAFRELLASKFEPGELTFGRYLRSAEQVYLSVLDELQNAAVLLRGLQAVDLDQIRAQVRILERKSSPSEAETRELDTLQERLGLREQELERIRGLLATNERALTTLTLAGTSLANVRTAEGRSAIASDDAMRELEELAERAGRYAIPDR